MRAFYLSLWDQFNVEATFPGYTRQMVTMDYRNGRAVNTTGVSWPVWGAVAREIHTVKIHDGMYGEPLFEFKLTHPVRALNSGDTINFAAEGVTVQMDGGMGKTLMRSVSLNVSTFEEFMEKNPDATPAQVWEAAFVAGHQTAYTLLTGEPQ